MREVEDRGEIKGRRPKQVSLAGQYENLDECALYVDAEYGVLRARIKIYRKKARDTYPRRDVASGATCHHATSSSLLGREIMLSRCIVAQGAAASMASSCIGNKVLCTSTLF